VSRGKGFGLKMKKNHLTILFIFCFGMLSIQGCEDDPLLAPQTGSEEDAGSYGNLVPLQDLEEEIREKNPEIF
tara:strand:+ start:137 stop:355 length:219 start_codon:yes stop_codon:yes gene_type:complete